MPELKLPPGRADYFNRRESQERTLAASAVDCSVRRAHLAMADHYARLVRTEMRIEIESAIA